MHLLTSTQLFANALACTPHYSGGVVSELQNWVPPTVKPAAIAPRTPTDVTDRWKRRANMTAKSASPSASPSATASASGTGTVSTAMLNCDALEQCYLQLTDALQGYYSLGGRLYDMCNTSMMHDQHFAISKCVMQATVIECQLTAMTVSVADHDRAYWALLA